ncbi:TetR/AcrR family transcriptional regulator [Pseudomonas sp. MT3]|uniref:TetR/AcrR family transcriptional regulator n=1 Tax=Pseudomonas sp. ATCC 13867 TaxID=1294143 RepID=UPI0002C4F14C|nr:TetR/AcrR family transcriptional regulator [Pseudomonas sp. ATCC 13867]AGI25401.1 TetR family transcriptional regulator [Pseudomonas sp. ATCC 13867]
MNERVESQRQVEKREGILAAATEMFLEEGYAGVSVDAIIARIGGSKRTLYAYFGDKDGLFAAIIARLCEEIVNPLRSMDLAHKPLPDALREIAGTFFDVVLSPRTIAIHRLIVAEAPRAPEAARSFFEAAPGAAYGCLTEYFRWADAAGLVSPGDAQTRAVLFLDALTGDFQLRCLLGLMETPSRTERQHRLDEAIAIFLSGLAR